MSKSTNQKRKLLCLMQILLEQTDEDHFLPLARLTELLAQQGIEAERKVYMTIWSSCVSSAWMWSS